MFSMENVCRTCLRFSSSLTSIFDWPNLFHKIEAISAIQLESNSKYPTSICQECVNNVNKFYNFKKVIINSDKEIKERLQTLEKQIVKNTQGCTKIKDEIVTDGSFRTSVFKINNTLTTDFEEKYSRTISIPNIKKKIKEAILKKEQYKCPLCGLILATKTQLSFHKKRKHVKSGVCNVCGMVMRSDNLKRHIQIHLEDPKECDECGKLFKNSESLRGHKLVHKGITYTCDFCNRTFKVKAEYKRHVKSHSDPDVRKVKCPICNKRIRGLKRHMLSHSGEKPYVCAYCKKGFTSPYSLKVHTRQHTKEKPYICEYCYMGFHQKVSLDTHLKSKHKHYV